LTSFNVRFFAEEIAFLYRNCFLQQTLVGGKALFDKSVSQSMLGVEMQIA